MTDTTAALGCVRVELPDGRYDFPITSVNFRGGLMYVSAEREVHPDDAFILPAGRWPLSVIGVDGSECTLNWLTVESDQVAINPAWSTQNVTFTLVVPWRFLPGSPTVSSGE